MGLFIGDREERARTAEGDISVITGDRLGVGTEIRIRLDPRGDTERDQSGNLRGTADDFTAYLSRNGAVRVGNNGTMLTADQLRAAGIDLDAISAIGENIREGRGMTQSDANTVAEFAKKANGAAAGAAR